MTHVKILLLVVGVLCVTSPALAGASWTPWNPWMPAWACSAFEYAKKCNAERSFRSPHCRCIVR
jgi:hypothetical protein